MSFETKPEAGLYDHNGQPVDPNSPGVLANHFKGISPAIASGMVQSGLQGSQDLVQNAADTLNAMESGNQASDRS